MVYQLIALGTFGKSDKDSIEDFKNAYTFHDAFVVPFRPTDELPKPVPARPRRRKQKSEQGT
jgi:hypothetical protein